MTRSSSRSSTSTSSVAGSRCRSSQANDSGTDAVDEFDPYLYGMPASYDEAGAYIGPGLRPQHR